ncbi:hypothetical protein [Mesorhizobium humile]|uniref:Uncharacterized protein n=1 Tax=Mesorhizobium humile TaxID=3072313 RepID=A0ABU4YHC6_9HYPH|nr:MULTISPECIES: hypothetical protein [unclassified Mesorhizobium]MDX8461719.1 hypothetical protein [Mesorhizobium sp. VK2D]MDX8486111.1 hypothetical protein [Mesorhizobium sp. VK2B]
MSGGTRHDAGLATLVARRLALVAEISALTAETQRLNQKLSGIQMEVLRLELEIGRHGGSAELVRDLHDAEESAEAMRHGMHRKRGTHRGNRGQGRGCRPRARRSNERH